MASKHLVLRTVYLDPEIDNALRNEAFEGKASTNDLIRKYLKLGMQQGAVDAASSSGKKATRAKSSKAAATGPSRRATSN